jgi:hypothetical protein
MKCKTSIFQKNEEDKMLEETAEARGTVLLSGST